MKEYLGGIMTGTLLFAAILMVAIAMAPSKETTVHVTPAQLDSVLVEAAYRLLSERDSVIRECAKRLGPLDPECGP